MSSSTPILALKPACVQRSATGAWVNPDFGDFYFYPGNGIPESTHVFLEKNDLHARFQAVQRQPRGLFTVAELGFGCGLNMLLAWRLWRQLKAGRDTTARLDLISFEKHPLRPEDLRAIHASLAGIETECARLQKIYPPLIRGFHPVWLDRDVRLILIFGDAAEMMPQLSARADAWFLDGFSPARNPDLWTEALCRQIAEKSRDNATVSTFSAAGKVRRALAAAGFHVEKTRGYGHKADMTVARLDRTGTATQATAQTAAVIGAGIAGAAAASALARRGLDVTVYDRHPHPAGEASGNPVGILYPKPTADDAPAGRFSLQAFCFALHLLEELAPQSWQPCGVARPAVNAVEENRYQKILAIHGLPADIATALPETPGLFHARGGMVAPGDFISRLLDHPRIAFQGGRTQDHAPVSGHDLTVIATANAARRFIPQLSLRPLRGQMITLAETETSGTLAAVLCREGYLTPAQGGLHYAGATFQKESPSPDAADHLSPARREDSLALLDKACRALPTAGFTEAHLRAARATFRATTPDKLPYAGAVPDSPGLFVLTGLGAHGLTTAPLCGEIVASLALGEALPVQRLLFERLAPGR